MSNSAVWIGAVMTRKWQWDRVATSRASSTWSPVLDLGGRPVLVGLLGWSRGCRRSLLCQAAAVTDPHRVLRLTYDPDGDAAYVYLQPPTVVQPSVGRTEPFDATINLDFDDKGRLIGVEVLAARRLLRPELLDEAID